MRETYVVPEMDIIAIESEDVIMTSNNDTPFEPTIEGLEGEPGNLLLGGESGDILGF